MWHLFRSNWSLTAATTATMAATLMPLGQDSAAKKQPQLPRALCKLNELPPRPEGNLGPCKYLYFYILYIHTCIIVSCIFMKISGNIKLLSKFFSLSTCPPAPQPAIVWWACPPDPHSPPHVVEVPSCCSWVFWRSLSVPSVIWRIPAAGQAQG